MTVSGSLPLVSVVMPAYNAAGSIGAAISSVLSQTYRHFELVIVDDGSSDETASICSAYGNRVKFIRSKNFGVARARNLAISASSGDLLTFCDADDQLLPNALVESVKAYRLAPPRSIITSEALILSDTGLAHGRRLLRGNVPSPSNQRLAILERNFVGIFSTISRNLWDDLEGFDESHRSLEDWDLWLRAIYAGWRVHYQPKPVALYRMTKDSLSTAKERFTTEADMLYRFYANHRSALSQTESHYLQYRLAGESPTALRQLGGGALTRGDASEARRIYRRLAKLTPRNPRVRLRAVAAGWLPGAMRVLAWRQRSLERELGGRFGKA